MSESYVGGVPPSEALALANAIALRDGLSGAVGEQTLAWMAGEPYEPRTPDELREGQIGRTVLYLANVDGSEATVNLSQLIEATYGVSVPSDSEADDEKHAQDFAKTLAMARVVAAERGVTVAAVYENDELYYETLRRVSTPAEMAEDISTKIDNLSGELWAAELARRLESTKSKAELDGMSPEEVEAQLAAVYVNSQVHGEISRFVDLFNEAVRQAGLYHFLKTYGLEGLTQLTNSRHRDALSPRQPLTPGLFESFSPAKRRRFWRSK